MIDYQKDLQIENIQDDLTNLASLYSFYHSKMMEYKEGYDQAKRNLDSLSAIKYLTYRHSYEDEGKKFTEKVLESLVTSDDEVIRARTHLDDKYNEYYLYRGVVESLSVKKDALVQLSANNRAEIQLHNSTPRN